MPEYDDNEKELEPTPEDLALAEDILPEESDIEDDEDGVNDADEDDEFLDDAGL